MTRAIATGLSGYGLEVPNIKQAEDFYVAFGLDASYENETLLLGSPGLNRPEVICAKGEVKKLHHVSFFTPAETLDEFETKLKSTGLDVQRDAPEGWHRPGLWFKDPWGTWINLTPAEPTKPIGDEPYAINSCQHINRVDEALFLDMKRDRKPRRIGHMLIFTQDYEKAEQWFVDVLGLQVTDRAKGKVSFMGCVDGVSDHHCFGIITGTHRGFQHSSFEVDSIDDIGFNTWRAREAGYGDGFGPGRHALASNLFHYVKDPWGSWAEYYADMDKITEKWECRDHEQLPYAWGPEWSPEFWGGEMNANLEPAE